jgi:hypothetical protein
MTDKWKDRIIRGGAIAVGTVAGVGCVTGLIGVAVGSPAVLRAGSVISPRSPASDWYPSSP